jgi:protein TonB
MIAARTALPGTDLRDPWTRLFVACALSAGLHAALLSSVPINPTGGALNVVTTITARLVSTVTEPAEQSEPPAAPAVPENPPALQLRDQAAAKPQEAKPVSKPAVSPIATPSTGLDIPLIRDPVYYTPKELDAFPTALAPIQPACPESAAAQRVNGQVRLLVLIDEFGIVNDTSVLDAQPAGYFEEPTLAAFRAAKFSPAQRQGRAVKSRATLLVKFICNSGEADAR